MDERGEPETATRATPDPIPAGARPIGDDGSDLDEFEEFDEFEDGYEEYVYDGSMTRDDWIFLAFALVVSGLLALWYPLLGLITLWVFTAAAWWRWRPSTVRWVLTVVGVLLVVGVVLVGMTS